MSLVGDEVDKALPIESTLQVFFVIYRLHQGGRKKQVDYVDTTHQKKLLGR
jgi:hypothetical protein